MRQILQRWQLVHQSFSKPIKALRSLRRSGECSEEGSSRDETEEVVVVSESLSSDDGRASRAACFDEEGKVLVGEVGLKSSSYRARSARKTKKRSGIAAESSP